MVLRKGVYNLTGWVKTQNVTAATGGLRLQLDFRPTLGLWLTTDPIKGTNDWTFYEIRNIVVPQDLTATLKLENFGNPSGTAWFDDVRLEEKLADPLQVFMLHPNYRGMLFDDQPQAMRFEVTLNPPAGTQPGSLTVTGRLKEEGSGRVIATRSFTGAARFEATLDGSPMQPGQAYLAEFSVNSTPAYTYPAYRVSKVRASTRPSMNISFDAENRLLIRGKPRFLLGIYDSGGGYSKWESYWEQSLFSPTGPRRLEGLRVNFYLNYWLGNAANDAMNALMSTLQKRGIMFLQTGNCFDKWAAGPDFSINASDGYVQQFGAHPGSAGYYTADECRAAMVEGVFEQYTRLRRLDPDSMTFSALFGNPELDLWKDAVDVLATDPYPLWGAEPAGGYDHKKVADWTAAAREAVRDSRPVMTVLQFLKATSVGRWPTRQEMRNHAYMAIVEGAKGLWWWSAGNGLGALAQSVCSPPDAWCAQRVAYMENLKAVVGELADLEPVLLASDAPGALRGNSNPSAIRTMAKIANGRGYVLAYNYTGTPQSATLTWNAAPGTVTVHNEGRTIGAAGASFTDTFGPFQAHVYVLGNGGTAGTPPPPPPPPPAGAPTASFTNPAAGAKVSGTVTVTMAGSGGSGSGYTYRASVDGAQVYAGSNPSFSWNTTAVANGSRNLAATVTDSAGKTSTPAARTVTVSNGATTPPSPPPPPPANDTLTLALTAPKAGATLKGTAWTVLWLGGTTSTANTYVVTLGGVEVGRTTTASRGPISMPLDTTKAPNGQQPLVARATDAAGKTGTAQVTVSVANSGAPAPPPPASAPTVAFVAPAAGATVSGTVTVTMTAAGGSTAGGNAAASYTYRLAVNGAPVYSGASPSFAWNTTALGNTTYTLSATVTDAAGKTSAPVTRPVTVANAVTPPATGGLKVFITAPKANAVMSGTGWLTVWLEGATGTANTYTVAVAGVPVATVTTPSRGPVAIAWNTRAIANGARTVTVTAKDAAGKTGSSSLALVVTN
jgi:hypothetical protein